MQRRLDGLCMEYDNERRPLEYRLLSLTYKVLTTSQPSYLNKLISVQPPRSTRSSSLVTLFRQPTISLKITYRSFSYIVAVAPDCTLPASAPSESSRSLGATVDEHGLRFYCFLSETMECGVRAAASYISCRYQSLSQRGL